MNYKDEFIKRINVPKGMTPLEFLKTFSKKKKNENKIKLLLLKKFPNI